MNPIGRDQHIATCGHGLIRTVAPGEGRDDTMRVLRTQNIDLYYPVHLKTQAYSLAQRAEVARFIEDLTVSHEAGWYSVISLHGGGSPEAMKREIWRNSPVIEKVELVEGLLDRGILGEGRRVSKQPSRCCATGCQVPEPPQLAELPAFEGAAIRCGRCGK